MRASPAFQVTVRRFGVWQAALLSLLAITSAALLAWLASPDSAVPPGWRALAVAAGAIILAVAAPLLRRSPFSLRWDTQRWNLGPASSAGEEPWQGKLAVAIDLGGWMLLRFEQDGEPIRRPIRWLPVQRRGLEAQWHALRCAVYCARPEPGRDAGVAAANAQEPQE
jgi:hypothetical protein